MDKAQIIESFKDLDLDEESSKYLHYHATRFAYLIDVIARLRSSFGEESLSIMDIGPSYFTELLQRKFPRDSVCTMGFDNELSRGGHFPGGLKTDAGLFTKFDLNSSAEPALWTEVAKCQIIVLAEVIEHLHVAPSHVLDFIDSFIDDRGFLVIQTPNAVSLYKRILMVFGRNPYHLIRENQYNPGHFREYTKNELQAIVAQSGFELMMIENINYINYSVYGALGHIYDALRKLFPPGFKDGITCVLRKRERRAARARVDNGVSSMASR